MLTDVFGDIPFSEAIKLDEGVAVPAFDEQQQIYQTLIAGLDEANTIYASAENECE